MHRVWRSLASVTLSLAAVGVALLFCEAAARLRAGQPLTQLRLLPAIPPATSRELDPTIGGGALPPDINSGWLNTAVPPAPPRTAVDRELLARVQAGEGLDVKPFELLRIWNRHYVDGAGCAKGNLFLRLPPPLLVFDPPGPDRRPIFRYPPSRTLPGGLVTNRFGWRGRDIPLDKPPRTIRLAFVGASTTVGLHDLPYSYPEYVVHWLNLWAKRARLGVRFDGINAGREGISSPDVTAIVRQELVPMEPDLVLYYEGANQSLCTRPAAGAPSHPPRGAEATLFARLLKVTDAYVQLSRHLEELLVRVRTGDGIEPAKPAISLHWPVIRHEADPVINGRDLPGPLRQIVKDLDAAREALTASGGELAVSSFAWLVYDGLRLDPLRHVVIYRHLNEWCWPYRYGDVRRDLDRLNHTLARYATSHQLPFIDVAGLFPPDPDLFYDSIHLNTDGERIHAWIVFRALIPIIRARLESGVWPRPDRMPLREHPSLRPGYPLTPCNGLR